MNIYFNIFIIFSLHLVIVKIKKNSAFDKLKLIFGKKCN